MPTEFQIDALRTNPIRQPLEKAEIDGDVGKMIADPEINTRGSTGGTERVGRVVDKDVARIAGSSLPLSLDNQQVRADEL